MSARATFDLDRFERWVQAVITHPDGVRAGARAAPGGALVADVVLPSPTLDAEDRLDIYHQMYFQRLEEILEQDFAVFAKAVGRERFAALARSYLVAHPSTHPNLNQLGARFPAYVGEQLAGTDRAPSFVALAAFERAIEDAFHAAEAPAVGVDALLDVPADAWADVRLELVPALRLFAFDAPVDRWFEALRDGDGTAPPPPPEPSFAMVFRSGHRVRWSTLDRPQHDLLAAFREGAPLGDALGALLDAADDPARLMEDVNAWFRAWAADGLIARIRRDA